MTVRSLRRPPPGSTLRRWTAALAAVTLFALPATAADRTLLVIGDTGDCSSPGTAEVAAALRKQADWRQALLLEVGDLAYPKASRGRLEECHEPHFGAFRRLAVPGNHDWADPGAAGFFAIFPEPVPRQVDLAGPWRLLLLDSNLRDAAWQRQLDWLRASVAASEGRCLIAAWHHPRWSSGRHGDNAFVGDLWRLLAPYASFTLHGHDHHFEALPPLDADGRPSSGGLPSFISGNGGARLYAAGDASRSSRAHYGYWGFLRIDLEGDAWNWKSVDVRGRVVDQGSGQCRRVPPKR